jgi:DNA topoisomerase-3
MVQVCDRVKTKDDMLFESIEQYKEVFLLVRREFERVVQVCPAMVAIWQ